MADVPPRVKFILLFILGSMFVMFMDGLFFDNYITRPAMSMMHMEVKPKLYADPKPPSLEEYWGKYRQFEDLPANMAEELPYEIIYENGKEIKLFHITMRNVLHEIRPGVKVPMYSFNGRIPAPTIHVQEGDNVRVVFFNNGTDPHTIHWHGVNSLEHTSDGVPDLNQDYVFPGQTYIYNFTAGPSGTKMYHCHVEAPHHMTMGMFGALIIDPKEGPHAGTPFSESDENGTLVSEGAATQDHVLFFSEFDSKHGHVMMPGEMMAMGPDGSLPWLIPSPKFMMGFMPEFNEFMINGKSFPAVDPIQVKEGEIVRLRLINIGEEIHSIHIHGHEFVVTHKDGYALPAPFKADVVMVGPGERYDVWFEANNPGLWMVHDHAGMNAMANGYDPAGIMTYIKYEGQDSEVLEAFLKRVEVYNEYIRHADEDHGMQTPSSMGGLMMEMDMGGGMEGMDGGH